MFPRLLPALICALALGFSSDSCAGSKLSYRGELRDRGLPAEGQYDLRFSLLRENGSIHVAPVTLYGVDIRQGQISVEVEFAAELQQAAPLKLKTEVAAGGAGFVAIGEPVRIDASSALVGVCWDTQGNAGTNGATDFLGTTDAQPLVLRTRNVPSLRIEPSTVLFGGAPITTNTLAGSVANSITAGTRGAVIAGGGLPSGNSDPDFFQEGPNRVSDAYGSVGGGYSNQAGDNAGTAIDRPNATVAGGLGNTASGASSAIGGGQSNVASGRSATVPGGEGNDATGTTSTIGGGQNNEATGNSSVVAGGSFNRSSASSGSVGGGIFNSAVGVSSTVSGGEGNCAGGTGSWAGGMRAGVRRGTGAGECVAGPPPSSGDADGDEGTFLWADAQATQFNSNGPNRFIVRVDEGATFQRLIGSETSARSPRGYFNVVRGDSGLAPSSTPSANVIGSFESDGDAFLVLTTPAGSSRGLVFRSTVNNNEAGLVYASSASGLQFLSGNSVRMTLAGTGQLTLNTLGSAGSTTLCRNASNQIASCSSSARYKNDIDDLHLGLDAVARLRPVAYTWKDSGMADIGFVAEDVAALDERLITRNDEGEVEGVRYDRLSAVLAGAVQELSARERLQQADIEDLRQQLAELRAEVQSASARER
ncbi:MAG: tail fiber domain-containing protein [Lysobacterales bacterium]|nr:tail fiber domain-containing protein [Xanthomonadales bacterium]